MGITVSYEPEHIFKNKIKKKYKDIVYLDDLILYLYDEKKESITDKNKIEQAEAIVFTSANASRLNVHVFEMIPHILNQITNKKIYINNPPNILLTSLELIDDIKHEPKFFYESIDEQKIIELMKEFDKEIIGQDLAKNSILRSLIKMQWRKNSKKPLVLMFHGRPGIGKTETAKFLARKLYNGEIVREQMSMASNENSIKYYKSTEHTQDSFSKKLMNRTSNLILLDEFALAHPVILSAFFELFDEGIYTDSNYTVNMKNSIIICTSNILSREEMYNNIDEALLSRFDNFIEFAPFTEKEKEIIVLKIIKEIKKDMIKEHKQMIDWDKTTHIIQTKIKEFTNMRNIRSYIEDYLANEILSSYTKKIE